MTTVPRYQRVPRRQWTPRDYFERDVAAYERVMREIDVANYLADPRGWGTVNHAIEQALDRKRRERASRCTT